MAVIKTGLGVSDIKGSIQGTTFQGSKVGLVAKSKSFKNPSGNIQRVFASTAIPKMPNRMNLLLAPLSQRWNALSEANKQAWDAIRGAWLFTNKFGEQYEGSAYQVFISYNMRRLKAGDTVVNVPGSPKAAPSWANPILETWDIGFNGIYFQGSTAGGGRFNVTVYQKSHFLSWLFRRRRFELNDPYDDGDDYWCGNCDGGPIWGDIFGPPTVGEWLGLDLEHYDPNWPAPAPRLRAWGQHKAGIQPTSVTVTGGSVVKEFDFDTFQVPTANLPVEDPLIVGDNVIIRTDSVGSKILKITGFTVDGEETIVALNGKTPFEDSTAVSLMARPIVYA